MLFLKKNALGIVICAAIAAISTFLAGLSIGSFSLEVIGAPVFAIIIGMVITLIFPSFAVSERTKDGIKFTSNSASDPNRFLSYTIFCTHTPKLLHIKSRRGGKLIGRGKSSACGDFPHN